VSKVLLILAACCACADASNFTTGLLRVLIAVEPGDLGVGTTPASRFAYYNSSAEGDAKFAGFTVDVMRQAAHHAGLTLEMSLPQIAEDRTSAIQQLKDGRTDLLGGLWSITVKNIEKGADWTVPYHIGHVGALVKKPMLGEEIWGFFAPFTPAAWGFVVLFVFVYGVLIYALEQAENEDFPNPESPDVTLGTVFSEMWWHTTMVAMRDRDKPIKSVPGKILSVFFAAVVIILIAAYTANLAAFMITASGSGHFVKAQEDLKSKTAAVLCPGSTEQWAKSENVARKVVCAHTMSDSVELVVNGHADAALGWLDELYYHASTDCRVEVSALSMHTTEFAFPVRRTGDDVPEWRYSFNAALFKLRETGEFHKMRLKWFDIDSTNCGSSVADTNPEKAQIKIPNVIGLAIILAVGLLIAGFIELIERIQTSHDGGNLLQDSNPANDPKFKDYWTGEDETQDLLKPDPDQQTVDTEENAVYAQYPSK